MEPLTCKTRLRDSGGGYLLLRLSQKLGFSMIHSIPHLWTQVLLCRLLWFRTALANEMRRPRWGHQLSKLNFRMALPLYLGAVPSLKLVSSRDQFRIRAKPTHSPSDSVYLRGRRRLSHQKLQNSYK